MQMDTTKLPALTASEVNALLTSPDAIRALADYHDVRESEADSMGVVDAANHHRERRIALKAEAERIEAAWQSEQPVKPLLSIAMHPLRTDAKGDPAPPNSLPDWSECALRVENSDFISRRMAEGGHGHEPDGKYASELHRFIYEYDDANDFRSAWFLHRLELVLAEAKESTQPAPHVCEVEVVDHGSILGKTWHVFKRIELPAGRHLLYTTTPTGDGRDVTQSSQSSGSPPCWCP